MEDMKSNVSAVLAVGFPVGSIPVSWVMVRDSLQILALIVGVVGGVISLCWHNRINRIRLQREEAELRRVLGEEDERLHGNH